MYGKSSVVKNPPQNASAASGYPEILHEVTCKTDRNTKYFLVLFNSRVVTVHVLRLL